MSFDATLKIKGIKLKETTKLFTGSTMHELLIRIRDYLGELHREDNSKMSFKNK